MPRDACVTLSAIPCPDPERTMARMLMNLRHVPEDEAAEVRSLLAEHAIDYYETPPNRWGISMGAIWLRDDDQYDHARRLLDEYQARRREQARAEREQQLREGTSETFVSLFRRDPARWVLYLGIIAVLLYFTVTPFFGWLD